jgi:hypothetical protein
MRAWKWSRRIGVGVAGTIATIGALHLPFARPLLARLAGCPFSRVTPEQVEQAQRSALRKLRGPHAAPARPALGFDLDATTLLDVKAWARRNGIACEESRQGTLLKCDTVPAARLISDGTGSIDEVAFGFHLADHVLVNVTTLRTGIDGEAAAARLAEVATRLRRTLGDPAAARLPVPGWDGSGPAYVSYRFSDYLAEASAMRLPDRGVMVREHYVSAREITPSPGSPANHINGSFQEEERTYESDRAKSAEDESVGRGGRARGHGRAGDPGNGQR